MIQYPAVAFCCRIKHAWGIYNLKPVLLGADTMKKMMVYLLLSVIALVAAAATMQAADAGLDRAALLKLADDYLAALVAHDPGKMPLASDVKIVENVKRIKSGEGLWKTASSLPTDYKIVAADPTTQEVGGLVVMGSEQKPAQVGFRLKLVNGRIVEAEHLVMVLDKSNPMGNPDNPNLKKHRPAIPLEVPDEYADSHGRLIYIAKSYYDALDNNNGHLAPFASDCERHENGMRTAPSGGPSLGGVTIPGTAAPKPAYWACRTARRRLIRELSSILLRLRIAAWKSPTQLRISDRFFPFPSSDDAEKI